MKRLSWILVCVPVLLNAQREKGIHFEQDLSGQQVLEKAKTENKYIFMDCYATWCGPCKLMDSAVYSEEEVGNYLNAHFISIKVQMDTSKQDNEEIKVWYNNAHAIQTEYKVSALPSYLFFSSEGKIVHRFLGAIRDTDFVKLAEYALDPNKQYYTLLENYQHGIKNYEMMPYLSKTAKKINEGKLSIAIAQDYINNYLLTLKDNELYTEKNIEFIGENIQSSKDKSFSIFYLHSDKIDRISPSMKGFAQVVVNYIITKEEITPVIDAAKEGEDPNWGKGTKNIKKKYSAEYADQNILSAKVWWYGKKNIWSKYIMYSIEKVEKNVMDTTSWIAEDNLNDLAWEIFLHSNDKKQIKIGIKWMEALVGRNPKDATMLDTYANLLYKGGRTKEAMELEEKCIEIDPNNIDIKDFKEALAKMKKGERTWPQE
jgi:thioredoxin-related protein